MKPRGVVPKALQTLHAGISVFWGWDQSPFAQRLDEAVGNHELGCGNGAGVHAEGLEHGCETQILPSFEGEEFGPEFHDIGGLDGIENNAIDSGLGNWLGGLRASCDLSYAMSEY
jgi:hypothetical protein